MTSLTDKISGTLASLFTNESEPPKYNTEQLARFSRRYGILTLAVRGTLDTLEAERPGISLEANRVTQVKSEQPAVEDVHEHPLVETDGNVIKTAQQSGEIILNKLTTDDMAEAARQVISQEAVPSEDIA